MRLASNKIDHLKTAIKAIMPTAKIYLFGSRVDDTKKGGDIDLLILGERTLDFLEKATIEREFFRAFGEQKLDLVSFEFSSNDVFKDIALNEAIEL
ncbi:MAG: nucleotidyltransferase domain-containing protein [Methylovulum sp.]|uniref:nucleotidyltransferase family protein n=1 Tax=Methylovulum sp. TaxID=1916980 RepID=UPI00262715CF|nr:nucleotidyltransferase domain-containing protein [Methylovulum sp.]MDD2723478.1 nucleotidyltransferase domain-containing protein [Methylovulum sp.]MDD5123904.1 nucleotidyltransferase domain-containing protein [Methylovulum sp.]